jgi:cobalt/nickel transport system permease protein
VLVGPWLGSLALTVVLVVQSLLFADGGLSALGINIILMAFVPAFAGYGLFLLARHILPRTRAGMLSATALAAFASVVLASIGFTLLYAIGGNDAVPVSAVGPAMIGVHVLIGIGEAVITTFTVGAVMATRPDLVHGAAGIRLPSPSFATEVAS